MNSSKYNMIGGNDFLNIIIIILLTGIIAIAIVFGLYYALTINTPATAPSIISGATAPVVVPATTPATTAGLVTPAAPAAPLLPAQATVPAITPGTSPMSS